MIAESKVKFYLDKILSSNEFSESKSYSGLLKYLVEAAIAGDSPKEITIAADVFKKKASSDSSSDTNVRVYVHNLRKKLDSYYLREGKTDDVRISIPKGHYEAKFTKTDSNNFKKPALIPINIGIVLIIIALNAFFLLKKSPNTGIKSIPIENPVWSDFLQSDSKTQIVFGDWYIYNDYSLFAADGINLKSDVEQRHRYIRDPAINSKKDLQTFLVSNAAKDLLIRETEHTMLGKFAAWCLNEILPVFLNHDKEIELKLSSKLLWDDFNKYNNIYVGSYKTFGMLENMIKNLNTSYQVFPNSLDFYEEERDSVFSYQSYKDNETGYHQDYSLIAKIPGPNQNTVMIFASTGDLGHISSVKYFTDKSNLIEFEKNYLNKHPGTKYFEALIEVKGFERTEMSTKLLHFKPIESTYTVVRPE